jgi:hypothetical protein
METPFSSPAVPSQSMLSVIGSSPSAFALCPNVFCNAIFSKSSVHSLYNWVSVLSCQCTSPETTWYICRTCNNQRTKLLTNAQLKRHYQIHHCSKKRKSTQVSNSITSLTTLDRSGDIAVNTSLVSTQLTFDCAEGDTPNSIFLQDPVLSTAVTGNSVDVLFDFNQHHDIFIDPTPTGSLQFCNRTLQVQFNFLSEKSQRFFYYQNLGGYGLSYLTALAYTNNELMTFKIDLNDALLYANFARLCLSIPRGSQFMLCNIFTEIYNKFTRESTSTISINSNIPENCNLSRIDVQLPTSFTSLRSQFIEGKHSFLQNIPMPTYEVIGNHFYVSLLSCVAYVLALGLPIENLLSTCAGTENNNNLNSLSHSKKCQKIYSDGKSYGEIFDIITYITEWSDCFDPNTSSKNNRGSVYVKSVSFPRQIDSSFPVSFYSFPVCIGYGKSDRTLVEQKFAEELILFKSKENPLKFYDQSTQSMKFVYLDLLCSLQDQPERRSSCGLMLGNSTYACRFGYFCDYKRIYKVVKSCRQCFQSMLDSGTSFAGCTQCVNWDLPQDSDLIKFPPIQNYPMDSPFLTNDRKLLPRKLTVSHLTNVVQITFEKLTTEIWNEAEAKSFLSVHCINGSLSTKIISAAKQFLIQQFLLNEEINNNINDYPIPPTWLRTIDIDGHVEALMHLLFLGITKTILNDIQALLKTKNYFTGLITVIDVYLQPIIQLKLPWCKMIPYGSGKFGGHVSENYLAMARILKWFFFLIRQLVVKTTIIDDGNICFHNKFCQMQNVVTSCLSMLSRCLDKNVTERLIASVTRHVKIFLSYYAEFDENDKKDYVPSWIKKYNFLSLLNLNSQMADFGPLLNLWEGGYLGEKIITIIKPEIKSGLRKNWSKNVYHKIMRKYFLDIQAQKQDPKNINMQNTNGFCCYKHYYTSIVEVEQKILNKEAFVAHYSEQTGELLIILKTKLCYKIVSVQENIFNSDCVFHHISIEVSQYPSCNLALIECLLLPFIDLDVGIGNSFYYIVTDSWSEFNQNFLPVNPDIHHATYSTNQLI